MVRILGGGIPGVYEQLRGQNNTNKPVYHSTINQVGENKFSIRGAYMHYYNFLHINPTDVQILKQK
jgi:hypothetical protein